MLNFLQRTERKNFSPMTKNLVNNSEKRFKKTDHLRLAAQCFFFIADALRWRHTFTDYNACRIVYIYKSILVKKSSRPV